jgi:hypothetical protein
MPGIFAYSDEEDRDQNWKGGDDYHADGYEDEDWDCDCDWNRYGN